jgi:NADH dehydrogenase
MWLFVHLVQIIGFRNRVVVLINWAWDYFFLDRPVRLITAAGREHDDEEEGLPRRRTGAT